MHFLFYFSSEKTVPQIISHVISDTITEEFLHSVSYTAYIIQW